MPHHIFLSYSRTDETIMRQIYDHLTRAGFSVWIDQTGIPPGEPSWQKAIEDAIDDAKCIVVIFSPDAKKSPWVREEMNYGKTQQKPIFPILARGDSSNAVPFGYSASQWVDIRGKQNIDAKIQRLTEEISKRIRVPLKPIAPTPTTPIYISQPEVGHGTFLPLQEAQPQPTESQAEAKPPINSTQSTSQWIPESKPPKPTLQPDVPPTILPTQTTRQQLPDRQTISEPTSTVVIKPFTPWLPWNQFRLLWWIFIQPARFADYREQVGHKSASKAGSWLASTLIWLPLLIPSIGTALLIYGSSRPLPFIIIPPIWITIVFFAWIITAQYVAEEEGIGFIVIIADFIVASAVSFGITNNSLITILITLGALSIVWGGVSPIIPSLISGTAFGTAFGIGSLIGGPIGGLVATIIFYGITISITPILNNNLKIHRSSFLRKFFFALLILSYAALVWIYWLGGWRVLSPSP